MFTKSGTKKVTSTHADRFTGKSPEVMRSRLEQYAEGFDEQQSKRAEILRRVLTQGADWETSSDMRLAMICAVKSKFKKPSSRLGAKKV